MSSRLHNKWHRHNHHTNPTLDVTLPDSGHDPIASPDSPFQGDFILNGSLSASQPIITPAIQATGNVVINGTLTTRNAIFVNPPATFGTTVDIESTGEFLEVRVNNQLRYIRLWKTR